MWGGRLCRVFDHTFISWDMEEIRHQCIQLGAIMERRHISNTDGVVRTPTDNGTDGVGILGVYWVLLGVSTVI